MQRRAMTTGDIRVIGLVAGTHQIEDIQRDVPHGMTVTIPAELAVRSKDLWRGIYQKCLFQLPTAAAAPAPMASVPDPERPRLEAYIRDLESQLRTMAAENMSLREELRRGSQDQTQKLDSILAALANGAALAGPSGAAKPMFQREEVADGSAPTFLPSQIKPKDVDVRIYIQGESSQADVSGMAERLRKVRKGET
jgi:hypothetical protein